MVARLDPEPSAGKANDAYRGVFGAAGELAVAIVGAVLLALGFLGLAYALIEGLVGEPHAPRWRSGHSARQITRLTVAITAGMLALTAAAVLLPGSAIADKLMEGVA